MKALEEGARTASADELAVAAHSLESAGRIARRHANYLRTDQAEPARKVRPKGKRRASA